MYTEIIGISRFFKLSHSLGKVLDDFSLVRFLPLNIHNEESIEQILFQIDSTIQYGEDKDVKTEDFDNPDPEDE